MSGSMRTFDMKVEAVDGFLSNRESQKELSRYFLISSSLSSTRKPPSAKAVISSSPGKTKTGAL